MTHTSDGPWYYQQIMLGFNYRMTDVQAALGLSQLKRLATFVEARHRIAEAYDRALAGLPVVTPYQHPNSYSGYHLYVVRLRLEALHRSHRQVFDALHGAGIGVNLHYIPVHLQPYYRALGFGPGQYPASEAYYAEAITLPLYPALTDAEQAQVVDALAAALSGRCD
jgi:dTDP-4-amino-4,6-dideoxygalactose transaminase